MMVLKLLESRPATAEEKRRAQEVAVDGQRKSRNQGQTCQPAPVCPAYRQAGAGRGRLDY